MLHLHQVSENNSFGIKPFTKVRGNAGAVHCLQRDAASVCSSSPRVGDVLGPRLMGDSGRCLCAVHMERENVGV